MRLFGCLINFSAGVHANVDLLLEKNIILKLKTLFQG
jgi:hypothetical protein